MVRATPIFLLSLLKFVNYPGDALPPNQSPTLEETWQGMENLFDCGETVVL